MDDGQTQDVTASPNESQNAEVPNILDSGRSSVSEPSSMPPKAPESSTNGEIAVPLKDQNGAENTPESSAKTDTINEQSADVVQSAVSQTESSQPATIESATPSSPAPVSAPAPQSPLVPEPQSPAQYPQTPMQQDQAGFIRALLAKANAKLGLNRQKKLDKLIQFAQKHSSVTNEQVQDLLHCSDATATRYLSKLVQQGRLSKEDGSHWVRYRFVR